MSARNLMLWTWALLAIHLLWMGVRYALAFPIWGDEAFVVNELARTPFADLFAPLGNGQVAPFLWLWIEKACYEMGEGDLPLLRLPAVLAGVASTLLMLRFCLRALPQPSALFGFAVFAASYYPLRHAVEVKPYAMDLLVALLQLNLALDLWRGKAGNQRAKAVALVLLSAVATWLSYPSLFLSAALAVFFLRHRSSRGPALLGSVVVGGSGLAMVLTFALPHAEAANWLTQMDMWKPTFPDWQHPWKLPLWFLERHAGYMAAYPTGGRDFGSSLSLLLMLVGVVGLWRGGQKAFLWLLFGPLVFNFLAACGQAYPYGGSVRVSIFLAPASCLAMGHGVALLLQRLRPRAEAFGGALVCLLLFAFAVSGVVRDLQKPFKSEGDVKALEFADWLAEQRPEWEPLYGWCNQEQGQPDFHGLGGSMARLRVQLRQAGQEILWLDTAAQQTLSLDTRRHTAFWVLAYTDDNDTGMPFPEADWQATLELLRLQDLDVEAFPFPFHKAEGVVAYRCERLQAY